MIEKIGYIRNPLTIVAIFAALAEVGGTIILPFISENNQALFIWFLMLFPTFLLVVFFLTLNFNHTVLYAPSDFKDERNFVQSNLKKATPLEAANKIDEEVKEYAQNPELSNDHFSDNDIFKVPFRRLEELALKRLEKIYNSPLIRQVSFGGYVFDGAFENRGNLSIVEVKHVSSIGFLNNGFDEVLNKISNSLALHLQNELSFETELFLVIVTPLNEEFYSHLQRLTDEVFEKLKIRYKLYIFSREELLE